MCSVAVFHCLSLFCSSSVTVFVFLVLFQSQTLPQVMRLTWSVPCTRIKTTTSSVARSGGAVVSVLSLSYCITDTQAALVSDSKNSSVQDH